MFFVFAAGQIVEAQEGTDTQTNTDDDQHDKQGYLHEFPQTVTGRTVSAETDRAVK